MDMRVRDTPEYAEFDRQLATLPTADGTQEVASGRVYPTRNNALGFFGASLTHTYRGHGSHRERVATQVTLDTSVMYIVQPNRAWPLEISMPDGLITEIDIASPDGEFVLGDAEAAAVALYRLAQAKSEENRRNTP